MIRLVIKGSVEQAQKAALERGLPIEPKSFPFKVQVEEVYADIDEHYLPQVAQWFCEAEQFSRATGFPGGTLLWYN